MQAATDRTTFSVNPNGQTVGLFVLVVYVAVMPKELMHLAFVFIGATGYLLFLLLQPSMNPHPWTKNPHLPDMPKTTGVANIECPKLMPVVDPNVADMPGAQKTCAAKAYKAAAASNEQNTFGAKASDTEISDDESTGVSSNENHETTDDETSVIKTRRTAGKNASIGEENQSKQTNSISMEADSTTRVYPSMKIDNTVCCPRFQRKKASTRQEKENSQSSEQLHDKDNKQHKEKWARLAEFKQEIMNERLKESQAFKQSVKEADKTPAVWMGTEMAGGTTRKKLSVAAAPFVIRSQLSTDATPFLCGPCVPNTVPSASVHLNEAESQTCWDWVSRGFCRRGPDCRWEHPQTEIFQEQSQGYETTWEHPQTQTFQGQFQNHETINHLPSHVGVWLPYECFELNDQNMVQVPTPSFVDSFFELNTPTMAQTPAPGQSNTRFEDSSAFGANNSFCEDDNDDVLTDDGF